MLLALVTFIARFFLHVRRLKRAILSIRQIKPRRHIFVLLKRLARMTLVRSTQIRLLVLSVFQVACNLSIPFLLNQLAVIVLGHHVGRQKLALVDLSLLFLREMVAVTFGSVTGCCAGGFAVALVWWFEGH